MSIFVWKEGMLSSIDDPLEEQKGEDIFDLKNPFLKLGKSPNSICCWEQQSNVEDFPYIFIVDVEIGKTVFTVYASVVRDVIEIFNYFAPMFQAARLEETLEALCSAAFKIIYENNQ